MKEEEMIFTHQQKELIRRLQGDLPLTSTPFMDIGREVGLSEEEVILLIKKWEESGIIRRFGAAIRHQNAGMTSNVMIVWRVPREKTKEAGKIMASFQEVSHCYERPILPKWPYNLYTMVHGKSIDDCDRIAAGISSKTGIGDYQLLFSTKEYKKSSMEYFVE